MIQISKLSKTYRIGFFMKARRALDEISLQVNEGDIYGFIGSNGAGKSTTIKILLGLLRYSEGEVKIFDEAPSIKARARLGYLPEHPYFYDYLTGREILEYYGQLSGLKGKALKVAIDDALGRVHADKDWIDTRLRRYSKGMVQRVGLAQAILHKPELLILDEPMSGLDPMGRKDVREAILSLNKDGTTIFYSSHVLGDVEKISNRIGMIVNGQMTMEGDLQELLQKETRGFRLCFQNPVQETLPEGFEVYGNVVFCTKPEDRDFLVKASVGWENAIQEIEPVHGSLEDMLSREIAIHG